MIVPWGRGREGQHCCEQLSSFCKQAPHVQCMSIKYCWKLGVLGRTHMDLTCYFGHNQNPSKCQSALFSPLPSSPNTTNVKVVLTGTLPSLKFQGRRILLGLVHPDASLQASTHSFLLSEGLKSPTLLTSLHVGTEVLLVNINNSTLLKSC